MDFLFYFFTAPLKLDKFNKAMTEFNLHQEKLYKETQEQIQAEARAQRQYEEDLMKKQNEFQATLMAQTMAQFGSILQNVLQPRPTMHNFFPSQPYQYPAQAHENRPFSPNIQLPNNNTGTQKFAVKDTEE